MSFVFFCFFFFIFEPKLDFVSETEMLQIVVTNMG